jgi:hypothetical protein
MQAFAMQLGNGFFLDDKFANGVADGNAFGFVHTEFVAAGNPFEGFLQQAGSHKTDGLVGTGAAPAAWAFMNGPYPFGIFFFHGGLLVT